MRKTTILFLIMIISLFFIFYLIFPTENDYFIDIQNNNLRQNNQKIKPKSVNFPNQMYTIEFYKDSYLTSVFYDERINSLRCLVVSSPKIIPLLSCKIIINSVNYTCQITNDKDPDCDYCYHNFLIKVDKDIPDYLYLNDYLIQIPKPEINKQYKNTLCLPILVNYKAANSLIQTFETNILFGVDHIVVYKTSCSDEVDKVLEYYKNIGIVEVITWNKTFEIDYLKPPHYGHIWKLNDCLYRMMHFSKSIVITDLDEVLWPLKGNNLNEMVKNLDDGQSDQYIFRQRLYHTEIVKYDNVMVADLPDRDIYKYQEYCNLKKGYLSKQYIYNVKTFTYFDIHFSLGINMKKTYIPLEYGFCRHTRRTKDNSYCESPWILSNHEDKEDIIQSKTNEIKQKININPILNDNPEILSIKNN